MSETLTERQKKFIAEYLIDFNATRASVAAGYSKKTARSMGYENLTKPYIKSAIRKYIDETLANDRMTLKREVIDKLREIAFSEPDIKFNKDGDVIGASRSDSLRALELLGKYMTMFTDKTETSLSTIDENGKPKGLEIVVKRANS